MINGDLAYWIGVVQSDGCLKIYFDKNRQKISHLISFNVGRKSLPMLEKFRDLSSVLFNRDAKIFKANNCESWNFHMSVKELLQDFKKLDIFFGDPPMPPRWSLLNKVYFGAYIAGLIDGDGDVRIKRKKYPQCVIRIAGGHRQKELANRIKEILNCSVSITPRGDYKELKGRRFYGLTYELEFYVSSKNYKFIKEFIIPHLTLQHKKERLASFIDRKWPWWCSS